MFVLVLCELDLEDKDLGGTEFPQSGFVDAHNWKPNNNMARGLYGALWGDMAPSWQMGAFDRWAVLRVETNDEFIYLDKDKGIVKFRTGAVVVSGDLVKCSKVIKKEVNKNVDYRRCTR